ncbi:MAG: L-lysine 6-transaminase [Synergistales bacterium]|nr:L-lysine 6-transaminase [Synergistales bacterium]
MADFSFSVAPDEVFSTIEHNMLRDGFDIVIDMEKSKGSHIVNKINGDEWLDFYTFFASSPFGMNHEKLANDEFKEKIFRAAINKVANSDVYTQEMAEFVKTFSEVAMPKGMEHLFLIDYGTLAVENTYKIAMDWKVRKLLSQGKVTKGEARAGTRGTKIIHFNEAFHGRSGYTLTVTNTHDPNKTQYFAKFPDWPRVINPKITWPMEDNLDNIKWLEHVSLKQIRDAIEMDPDDICALVIETIQGEGGDNQFRTEFFKELRKICDEFDVLLILDEVQCGMGITGKMWAFEHHDIQPDVFAFGKKAQICGCVAGPRVECVDENCFVTPSRINSTWGGNLVDMVRGTRYLEVMRDENILDYVGNEAGPHLLKGLHELKKEFPNLISNVRGKGLMCAFDFPNTELRDRFLKACHARKMLILPCGSVTMRFRPALNVPLKDIDKGMEVARDVLKSEF